MPHTNPTNRLGGHQKPNLWPSIWQKVLNLFGPNVVIVASPPFFKDGKWFLLHGDHRNFRIQQYPDQLTATNAFRAIENALLLDLGFPSYDLHLLNSDVAAKIVDLESYRAALANL